MGSATDLPATGPRVQADCPALELRDVSFSYPQELGGSLVLSHASLRVRPGAFVLLTGSTGSGKTTLLRLAKHEVRPAGQLSGEVLAFGRDLRSLAARESAESVGFVFQSPDNQIVCDTVWHELALGLENMGVDEVEMRLRIAETCQFLGIEPWFRRHTHGLSGGQRQMLALASVLVMRPRLLLLDEPTSQLDPVAEKDFLALLFRVNRELGVTVVVATHQPAPMVPYATEAYRLEHGQVREAALSELSCRQVLAWPSDTDEASVSADGVASVLPREEAPAGRPQRPSPQRDVALSLSDVWFRWHGGDWVMRGCDLQLCAGEIRALMGGNGSGKSTLLSLASGVMRPRRGRVLRLCADSQALLPQQPRTLLGCETVWQELMEWAYLAGYGPQEVGEAISRLGLEPARDRHPFDLSQGQQQLLALQKLLLTKPRLLLLDEPTKGLDPSARALAADALRRAVAQGATVLMATHDVGFVQALCTSVSLLFDGQVVLTDDTDAFFARSWVYGGAR